MTRLPNRKHLFFRELNSIVLKIWSGAWAGFLPGGVTKAGIRGGEERQLKLLTLVVKRLQGIDTS